MQYQDNLNNKTYAQEAAYENKTKQRSTTDARFIYSIPCECGRNYTGVTCRPLAVQAEIEKYVTWGNPNWPNIPVNRAII
jgi:hypothetical protein